MKLAMCGYRCDLCKAYVGNVTQKDEREALSAMWKKYYDLDIPARYIQCDGCRCDTPGAKLVDANCPVRRCVTQKELDHCGECANYPCALFESRIGLCPADAQAEQGDAFDLEEFEANLRAYDNKTRLDAMRGESAS